MKVNENNSNYRHGGSRTRARRLAYDVYKLPKKCEVSRSTTKLDIHHIDENPKNQDKENLVVLRHDLHSRLSAFNSCVKLKTRTQIKQYLSCFTQNEPALMINEIYPAIVGESTYMGEPCVIVRLTYCHNGCVFCDSKYSWFEGKVMTLTQIMNKIQKTTNKLIMITGGSPCLQRQNLRHLIHKILDTDKNYRIMVEASGTLHTGWLCMKRVSIIKDVKCPGSKIVTQNIFSDIKLLRNRDNLKFVIGDKKDYDFTIKTILKYPTKATILLHPVWGKIDIDILLKWFEKDQHRLPLNIRIGFQMHKMIWGNKRGV